MSQITVTVDGSEQVVDLAKVTGLDAMQYYMETGQDLDLAVLRILDRGNVVLLADLAVASWLWVRQSVDPLATFALVASSLTLFSAEQVEPAEAVEV